MNSDGEPSRSDNPKNDQGKPNIDDVTVPPKSHETSASGHQTIDYAQPNFESGSDKLLALGGLPEFGDYELIEEIARGGMGVVYRCRQKSLNRPVAVKMILAGQFASQEDVDRFYAEAKASANLDHPAIVPVYEFGQCGGHHFFSMKLIEGCHFGTRLKQLRDDVPKAVATLQQVCEAVHHAHQRGILHRDIKPGNILLDEHDHPYLTDLGLARRVGGDSNLTRTGAVIGTPSYMSPEQAAGNADITTASDIYSLGAILYEIMTGHPPFRGATPVETLMQVINECPERPSLSCHADRGLELICLKCLAKDPADRYNSAALLADDLQAWLNDEPISCRAPSLANVTRFWLKQNFGRAAWALLIGPIAGIISSLSLWYSTMSKDYDFVRQTYEALPSADMPIVVGWFTPPMWAKVPLMIVFALSIVFIGYVTAIFVRPKNRGADLAAGTIVGLLASLTAFLFAVGPMCILNDVDRSAISHVQNLSASQEGATPDSLIRQYPELENLNRREQVRRLADKINSDYMLFIPRGLWFGAFASLAFYFVPCLYETSVAGPILRKHSTLPASFPAYLEVAFPVVTLMTIIGVAVAMRLLLGGVGFTLTWRLAALLLMIVLAIAARRLNWQFVPRAVVQLLLVATFVLFFSTDFPNSPGIARGHAAVNQAQKKLKRNPARFDNHLYLLEAQSQLASTFMTLGRPQAARRYLDQCIQFADELSEIKQLEDYDRDEVGRRQCLTRLQKVQWLIDMDRQDDALRLWEKTRDQFPGYPELAAKRLQIKKAQEDK